MTIIRHDFYVGEDEKPESIYSCSCDHHWQDVYVTMTKFVHEVPGMNV